MACQEANFKAEIQCLGVKANKTTLQHAFRLSQVIMHSELILSPFNTHISLKCRQAAPYYYGTDYFSRTVKPCHNEISGLLKFSLAKQGDTFL